MLFFHIRHEIIWNTLVLKLKKAISSIVLFQIKSFLLVYEAVKTTINDQVGGGGTWEGSFRCRGLGWDGLLE